MNYFFRNSIPLRVLTILSFFYFSSSNAQKEIKKKPNFIIVLTDNQSWVGISFRADPSEPRSKSDYYQTPNLKRLAIGNEASWLEVREKPQKKDAFLKCIEQKSTHLNVQGKVGVNLKPGFGLKVNEKNYILSQTLT